MTTPQYPASGVADYDQIKAECNSLLGDMVDFWRAQHREGKTDLDIFGEHIAAIDQAAPSYERLAVMFAFAIERLARESAP